MNVSSRERNLMLLMGISVFLLLNILLLKAFKQRNDALRDELDQGKLEWANMQELLAQQPLWAARDAALTAKQPKLANENAAGVELYDLLGSIAAKHNVTRDNEVVGAVTRSDQYRSVAVTMDTHSTWQDLISFLYALQKPDAFIVCEDANIVVDPSDETKMLGTFKIARWYAP